VGIPECLSNVSSFFVTGLSVGLVIACEPRSLPLPLRKLFTHLNCQFYRYDGETISAEKISDFRGPLPDVEDDLNFATLFDQYLRLASPPPSSSPRDASSELTRTTLTTYVLLNPTGLVILGACCGFTSAPTPRQGQHVIYHMLDFGPSIDTYNEQLSTYTIWWSHASSVTVPIDADVHQTSSRRYATGRGSS
jgi:hypothetical protein